MKQQTEYTLVNQRKCVWQISIYKYTEKAVLQDRRNKEDSILHQCGPSDSVDRPERK